MMDYRAMRRFEEENKMTNLTNSHQAPCTVCGAMTEYACSDCQIDLRTTVYVCGNPACRDRHEEKCPRFILTLCDSKNLANLYTMLEEDNQASMALLVRCLLKGRLDLVDRAAWVVADVLTHAERGPRADKEYMALVAELRA